MRILLCSNILMLILLAPVIGQARVSGPCVNCHTMHSSQGGSPVAYEVDTAGNRILLAAPNKALLNTDCVGCHQGSNSGGAVPYVLDTGAPNYGDTGTEAGTTTLAGGNFYWVSLGQERTGHNIASMTAEDSKHHNLPPGSTDTLDAPQITCAGTSGCHGDPAEADPIVSLYGSHHGNDASVWKDGTSVAKSYRFLNGTQGFEDSDYEYQPTASAHNKYYGRDRGSETDLAAGSISSHCARCHGDFHNGNTKMVPDGVFGSGVWLRHPIDFDMSRASSSAEYTTYNGGTGSANPYSVVAPLGTEDTTVTVNSTVNISTNSKNAILMCISCHRAHGTPYDSIMRWDYKGWPGNGKENGCNVCHTAKD